MLIWITALHCEAKPVIDFYRLKKSAHSQPFDSYFDHSDNPEMICIVTGSGKIACAAATAWSAARYQTSGVVSWINLGTAGSERSIGDLCTAYKIIDNNTEQSYYPVQTFKNPIPGTVCRTLDAPGSNYKSTEIFDMEASSYFATASRFSTAEFIHSLKVVSDNSSTEFPSSKNKVSALIYDNFDPISNFADHLTRLAKSHEQLMLQQEQLNIWLERTHFTQSQQHQLIPKLQYLLNRNWSNQKLLDITLNVKTKEVLQKLDQIRFNDSKNL